MKLFVGALVLLVAVSANAANRCIDDKHRVIFQDVRCSGAPSDAQREAAEEAARTAQAKAASEHAKKMRLQLEVKKYPSLAALEAARQHELSGQAGARNRIDRRERELTERRNWLLQEAEFYTPAHKPLPANLKRDLDGVGAELTAQSQARENLDQQASQINSRLDALKLELQPLWRDGFAAATSAKAP